MSKPKMLIKTLTYLLAALAIVFAVGTAYRFTNGFNEEFKTFYPEYAGRRLLSYDGKLLLSGNERHVFKIRYTFDTGGTSPKDYTVRIVPCENVDFEFTVDGSTYRFGAEPDLSRGFKLEKSAAEFSFEMPDSPTAASVLSEQYGGKAVQLPENYEEPEYPYMLIVSSYNGKATYKIRFGKGRSVEGVELDRTGIVFGTNRNKEASGGS